MCKNCVKNYKQVINAHIYTIEDVNVAPKYPVFISHVVYSLCTLLNRDSAIVAIDDCITAWHMISKHAALDVLVYFYSIVIFP